MMGYKTSINFAKTSGKIQYTLTGRYTSKKLWRQWFRN
jgi:hypothetical protein